MKFETVLYAVSFFLLAMISLPENKGEAKKPEAIKAESTEPLTIAAGDEVKIEPAQSAVKDLDADNDDGQSPPRSRR